MKVKTNKTGQMPKLTRVFAARCTLAAKCAHTILLICLKYLPFISVELGLIRPEFFLFFVLPTLPLLKEIFFNLIFVFPSDSCQYSMFFHFVFSTAARLIKLKNKIH